MGEKSINIPKMDIKVVTALAVTIVAVCATCVSLSIYNRSGKASDGDVLEFLHTTIEDGFVSSNDDVNEQIDSYYKNLSTNSVYDTAELTKGETIYFAEGSTAIVTDGCLTAVCVDDHLVDITDGNVLADGEAAEHNHLYVIQNEDCGLYARGNAKVLIKGGYEIDNGNKE